MGNDPNNCQSPGCPSPEPTGCGATNPDALYDRKFIALRLKGCGETFTRLKTAFEGLKDPKALKQAQADLNQAEDARKSAEQRAEGAAQHVRDLQARSDRLATAAAAAEQRAEGAAQRVRDLQAAVDWLATAAGGTTDPTAKDKAEKRAAAARDEAAKQAAAAREAQEQAATAAHELAAAQTNEAAVVAKVEPSRKAADEACQRLDLLGAIDSNATHLAQRCAAGVLLASQPLDQQRPRETTADLFSLWKLIQAAFQPFSEFASLGQDRVDECKGLIHELGTSLRSLCLDLGAVEQKCSPRAGFLELAAAAGGAHALFDRFGNDLSQWSDGSCAGNLETIHKESALLIQESRKVEHEAARYAESCDLAEMRMGLSLLRRKLAVIQTTHEDLVCQLDFLACLPQLEPPLPGVVLADLQRAGQFVADAYRAVDAIELKGEDRIGQMKRAWAALRKSIGLLQADISLYEQSQLCGSPDCCRIATATLMAYMQSADQALAQLEKDSDCPKALKSLRELIDGVQTEMTRIACQVAQLDGFNTRGLDRSWWYIVQIRQLLTPPRKKRRTALTKDELRQILDGLRRTYAGTDRPEHDLCAATPQSGMVQTPTPPAANPPGWSPTNQDWAKLGSIAQAIARLVLNEQKPFIDQLVQQVAQQQLRSLPAATADERLAARARWASIVKALSAACTVAVFQVVPDTQRQLQDQLTSLAQIGGPVPGLNGRGQATANGVSSATRKGGAAR
jgi:hypothetical protein